MNQVLVPTSAPTSIPTIAPTWTNSAFKLQSQEFARCIQTKGAYHKNNNTFDGTDGNHLVYHSGCPDTKRATFIRKKHKAGCEGRDEDFFGGNATRGVATKCWYWVIHRETGMCLTTAGNAKPENGVQIVVSKAACPTSDGATPGGDNALWQWYQFKNEDGSEDGEILYNKASAPDGIYVHPNGGRAREDNVELVFFAAWDVGRRMRMLSLPIGTQPMSHFELNTGQHMPNRCRREHKEGEGCGWSEHYSCPGQTPGTQGRATPNPDDNNYMCCCKYGMWDYRYRAWTGAGYNISEL
jgi:hypothetical protein